MDRILLYAQDMEWPQRWENLVHSLVLEKDGVDIDLHVTSLMSPCSVYTEC